MDLGGGRKEIEKLWSLTRTQPRSVQPPAPNMVYQAQPGAIPEHRQNGKIPGPKI